MGFVQNRKNNEAPYLAVEQVTGLLDVFKRAEAAFLHQKGLMQKGLSQLHRQ